MAYAPSPSRTVIAPVTPAVGSTLSFQPRDPNEINSDFWLNISALLADKNATLRQMSAELTYTDGVMQITTQLISADRSTVGILTSAATPRYTYVVKFGALLSSGSSWYFYDVALPVLDVPLNALPAGDVSANGATLLFNGKTLPGKFGGAS